VQRDLRKGKKGGVSPDDLPAVRLLEAEIFEKAAPAVDDLYNRLRR